MEYLRRRKGIIKASATLMQSLDLKATKLFFSNFYIEYVDNSMENIRGEIKFFGYSEHFDVLPEGEGFLIPEYVAEFDAIGNTIKFTKG